MTNNGPLEIRVEVSKPEVVHFREYSRVFAAVEGLALVGANAGIYIADRLTRNNFIITGSTLVGDYVGGTIGQLGSYWYNNAQKFRDDETGRFQFGRFLKDSVKVLMYDMPVTAVSYATTSPLTHLLVEHNLDNWIVAASSSISLMVVWNSTNYFVYSIIKFDKDEKLGRNISSRVKSMFSSRNSN